jgi:hypothetical protein
VADCQHKGLETRSQFVRMIPSGRLIVQVQISCTECGEQFKFDGVERGGTSFLAPSSSKDGRELRLPISPDGPYNPNPRTRT